jgi:hypothetical protein
VTHDHPGRPAGQILVLHRTNPCAKVLDTSLESARSAASSVYRAHSR